MYTVTLGKRIAILISIIVCIEQVFMQSFALKATPQINEKIQLAQIKKSDIDQYEKKAAVLLRRDKIIKVATITAAVGLLGYFGYKIFFGAPSATPEISSPEVSQSLATLSNEDKIDKVFNFIQKQHTQHERMELEHRSLLGAVIGLQQSMAEAGIESGVPRSWSAIIKMNAKYYWNQLVIGGLFSIMAGTLNPFTKYLSLLDKAVDSVIDRVFHENTVRWFNSHQLREMPTATILFNRAQEIDQTIAENKPIYATSQQLMVTTWHLYMKQIAAVLGFIQYKQKINAHHSIFFTQKIDEIKNVIEEQRLNLNDMLRDPYGTHYLGTLSACIKKIQNTFDLSMKEIELLEATLPY